MFRWKPLAALAAVTALSLVSACSSGGQEVGAEPGEGQVTFWSFLRGSDAVAAAFNESHPGIKVNFVNQAGGPDYYTKLSNAMKSGQVPDAAVAEYTRLPEIVSLGGATDLTGEVGPVVQKTFPGAIQELVTLGGKTWGVPRDASAMLYFYRKDFFDEHELSVPETWADYKTLAAKVKSIDSGKRAGAYLTGNYNLLSALSWQAGGKWFGAEGDSWAVGINDEPSLKVAGYWQDLLKNDLVTSFPDYTDQFWQDIQNNDLVGYFCASWCAGNLKATVPDQSGDWAVAELPSWDGESASAMWGGSSFIVPKGAKNSAAALEFIKWITTDPQGIAAWFGTGVSSMYPAAPTLVPEAKKGFTTEYFGGQDIYAVLTDSYDSAVPGWRWGPAMATTESAFNDRLGKAADGSAQLTDIFSQVQDATVKALKDRGLTVAQ
ncbi:carbohydrate ABC transporter substrate-binding protein (CUT1 family) [Actinocorallia herbida]|uniref:Carbohydrate ABC transporter substrate-binding protein (CUT1 family) n=1 Tax=Actinocorallia herbida TaxID=58109 RepID=A0A3N1CV18_9ACTN|nr:extracellular solute-binding protein [Actinocorallia herbida]ROO85085.1 carbohydrate ABC transporter substrate-binding protein (CUT1 family) [Actinocorallia herbida]